MLARVDVASVRHLSFPLAHPLLVEEGLGVWSIDLEAAPAHGALRSIRLSPDERARAVSYPDHAKGRRFAIGRAAVRAVLGELAGRDPAQLSFSCNPHGKPSLAAGGSDLSLHFNVSHARDLLVIAVASLARVGVDVAQRSGAVPLDKVVARFFSPAERSAYAAAGDEHARRATFARIWVRKEAYLKGRGEGISQWIYATDFRDAALRDAALRDAALRDGALRDAVDGTVSRDQDRWEIRDLDGLPDGFVASVAMERVDA